MIKIVIIDGQKDYRDHVQLFLSAQDNFKVVGVGEDGYEAINLTVKFQPDIVLMDINLPLLDGARVASILRCRSPATAIIIITNIDNDEYIQRAISNGVAGYFLKSSGVANLGTVIKAVCNGGCFISPQITARVFRSIYHEAGCKAALKPSEEQNFRLAMVSEPELCILSLIGGGFSNKEIAAMLQLKEGTVRNYISSILHKLKLRDRTQIAIYALVYGFTVKEMTWTLETYPVSGLLPCALLPRAG
jgi:DNA-binding NarL/FixJ family response regulator